MRIDISQYRGVLKVLLYFALAVFLSRVTEGAFIFVVAIIGAAAVTKRRLVALLTLVKAGRLEAVGIGLLTVRKAADALLSRGGKL